MLSGLGRGAITGAAYGFLVVLGFSIYDPGDEGLAGFFFLISVIGAYAAGFGALYAFIPGGLGGLVLAALAEVGLSRRGLVVSGALTGATLGFFEFDAYSILVDEPHVDGLDDLLLWRIGPACAGSLGAAWQGWRTRLPPPGRGRHRVG